MRAYRLIVRLYPASFRARFAGEMFQVFEDLRRDRGPGIWLRIVTDALVSVPAVRLKERSMRTKLAVAGFGLVMVAAVALVTGARGAVLPVLALVPIGALALIFAIAALVGRAGKGSEAVYSGGRRWWWILAALLGAGELFMGVGQLVDDPKSDNVFALLIFGAFAALIFGGMAIRNRRAGNWMIAAGALPLLPFVWMVVAPIASLLVIVLALADNVRMSQPRPGPAV